MFENMTRLKKMKEKGNVRALYKATRHRNEEIWTTAIDSLIELDGESEWKVLFSKLSQEKQDYCINMLIHRLAISEYREKALDIIKKIGDAAAPAVLDMFCQHVNTIRTTEDFEKLQGWLNELLDIVVCYKPSEAANRLIEIYGQSSDQDVRYMILDHLGQLGDENALEFIRNQLSDESIHTRAAAIRALGLTRDSRNVPLIMDSLENNGDSSLIVKTCLEALIAINDEKSIEILVSYLDGDVDNVLKERIADSLLRSPYISTKDIEAWFRPDSSYEVKEILIKAIVNGKHGNRISSYIIEHVTGLCLASYGKGNDIYTWGVRLLQIGEKDALPHLMNMLPEEKNEGFQAVDALISEFGSNAFPYLKAIYLLAETWEEKGRIIRVMALSGSDRLGGFLIENIDDISSLLSIYIRQEDEVKVIELIEIMGNAFKGYSLYQRAIDSIMVLLLSKCREASYSDEERFFIKILFRFYKYFYFKELEDLFIAYLDRSSAFWRYAVRALEYHETAKAKDALEQFRAEYPYDKEIIDEEQDYLS